MKKKILSILLALSMVLSFFPGMTVTASAEELDPPQARWGFEEGNYSAGSGSLYDAFDAANNSEEEVIYVQVTGNGAENDPYYCLDEGAADMVLDLNDCTLTFTFPLNNRQVFESNDNLTIQNGTIEVTSSKRLITAIYSCGDLTIEDCTINVSADGDVVGVYAYGNLTVKDSAISATNTASSEVAYAIQLDSESTLDVVDSQISATAENSKAYGIECTYSDSVITVTGTAPEKCTVSATGGSEAYGINSWSTVSVTNTSINVDSDGGANGIVAEGDGFTVTNCDIRVDSADSACGIWAVAEFAVSGGSITVRGDSAATGIDSEGFDGTVEDCDISVEKYGSSYEVCYGIYTANSLTVTGGSITAINSQVEDATDAYGIYTENSNDSIVVTLAGALAISGESADVKLGDNATISAADYEGGMVEIDWITTRYENDVVVSNVTADNKDDFRLCGRAAENRHLKEGTDGSGNPALLAADGAQADEPGEPTGTTYKWSEIIAENSEAFKATLKPGDIIVNDGSGVRFYVGDRHDYDDVWMDAGATWIVPEAFDADNNYSIESDSWTWMKDDDGDLVLVKTADAKYAELIEVEVEQNENGKFTVTFEQEEGFIYIYMTQADLYEEGQNADEMVAMIPEANKMIAAQRQTTTSLPENLADSGLVVVTSGTFEVDSSIMGMLIKLKKDTEFDRKPNTHLQVGMAYVISGRIARNVTVTATENGTVTAIVRDSESTDKAKELDIVSLTVTPAEGYKLNSLTVTDAEGNEVLVEDDNFVMPRSAVTVTAVFVELGEGGGTTYKWSEIIAEGSAAYAATVKPGDTIVNDGSNGVRFFIADRHYRDDIWIDAGATWTVPSAHEATIGLEYTIASDSWTWMKDYEGDVELVKTADAKYTELVDLQVAQNENGKFTVTFEQEEGFLYIYTPQADLYEEQQNADDMAAMIPEANAMIAALRQETTSLPENLDGSGVVVVTNGTFEVDSSMMGILFKVKKDTDVVNRTNNHLQVGMAYVISGRIARDITIADTTNGTVTAIVRDSESNDKAKELDIVSLTVTPAEGYKLDSLTVTDAEGNEVLVEDDNFVMPRSAVTVTATFVELDEGGEPDKPEVELGTIVNLGENCITVDGNTVTVNKPEGDDEYIYFLTVLPEIYLEGTGMTAEQYVERHMLGVDKSIIDATTLDLTDVPGIHELANTTQIFVTNIETYESLDGYISGDSVVIVLKLHPDNVKVATYDSAADNPYFGSVGFTTAYAYGIYGVYATRVSAGAGAEVASAELTFTYEETIGAIVAGEELPDLSVLAPEHIVVKDTDGNVLTVVDVYADWLCKAPDLDEGWGWPDSNIAQEGMEYGIRIEVIGDGSYSFGTSWDDLTVLTCQDEKLSVNSAWVGDPNSAFVAFIEMSTVQQPEPPHEHSYAYTSNGNGTHNGACECGEDAITNEACTYVDGTCSKCGYEEPVTPPEQPDEPDLYAITVTVKEETENDEYVTCDDATVTLIGLNGETQTRTQSIGNGVYAFENVSNGIYNLAIQRGDKSKTILVTVDGKNVDLGVVYLPVMEIKSEVNVSVEVGDDSAIEGALVGGLDQLAEDIAGDIVMEDGASVSVEVSMQINAQMSDDVDAEHKSGIEEEARTQSENLTFLDITIDKTITTQKTGEAEVKTTDPVHDTVNLLEIVIPFDTDGRYDFAVYRYHENHRDGDVQKLTTSKNSDGEYITVEDGVIKMYVRYFSTYAIGYSDGTEPTEYTVSFDANGGTGTMADATAAENTEYTLPECGFTAPEGMEFRAWEIDGTEYAPGDKITITADVTVKAVWKEIVKPSVTPDTPIPSYRVIVKDVSGGTIRVVPTVAAVGSVVSVAVTPDKNFELVDLVITNAAGEKIQWMPSYHNEYTFVMPAGDVTVTAFFCRVETACPKDSTCPICSFKDAATTEWYHDGVHYCIENGLMNGLPGDLFDPNGTATRAQIVTILWRLEGEPYANYAMSFTDVADGQWYTEAVRWAAAEGIVNGYSDTVFAPNDAITREQFVAILWRYCQYKGIDVSVGEDTNILSYTDVFDVHSWAMDAMQWACGAGVINGIADGNGMKLDPSGSAARAQVATMLWRFCEGNAR